MKKILFVSFFALMFAFSVNAYSADQGWYFSGNAGISKINDSDIGPYTEADIEYLMGVNVPTGTTASAELTYDTGYIFGVAVGYDFGDWRYESELSYQNNDTDQLNVTVNIPGEGSATTGGAFSGKATSFSLLFNGYYDFLEGNKLRPYITGGIGISNVNLKIMGSSENSSVFAYQIGAGLGYDMNKNVTWDLRYRYLGTSNPEFDGIEVKCSGHFVVLGLRYYF